MLEPKRWNNKDGFVYVNDIWVANHMRVRIKEGKKQYKVIKYSILWDFSGILFFY